MDIRQEAMDVLGRLIRFNTVNPPGNEEPLGLYLRDYLADAGFEVELHAAEPGRTNLVATLRGDADGPSLGYLSHADTVLADPKDWSNGDPWSGDVVDGELWGRGALDMKSQTAAEVVGAAALARSGWRPARGALKVIVVADEEVGGILGAKWLTETHPELARVDWLVNEGGGAVMPYGERRLYGVCCAEKGTFRFRVEAHGTAGHASIPRMGDNALTKLVPALERIAHADAPYDVTPEAQAFLTAVGLDAEDPDAAIEALRAADPRLAAMIEPTMQVTMVPTRISASEKINVIPAHAELKVDCRVPPGMGSDGALRRIDEVLGERDGLDVSFIEEIVGNRSPVESPLMDAIRDWIGAEDPGGEAVPVVLPAFTDSRWWRTAYPDCVAYGFFPQRRQSLYETWPLIHGADERIDVDDLAWATGFFRWLPRRLLGG